MLCQVLIHVYNSVLVTGVSALDWYQNDITVPVFTGFQYNLTCSKNALWKERLYLVAWKPDANLDTLRTFTQRGIHIIARYHECPSFHGFRFELTYSRNAMRENKTISLNTWRGNQIQILIHCRTSLEGV